MKRSSLIMAALALLGVAAAAWFLLVPRGALPKELIQAVPLDVIGVARVRVDRVIASDAYKRLVVERGEARGLERVQVLCGFNPLERISDLVVFARPAPGGGTPRFAFVARGELKHEELLDCVKKFTGGDVSALHYEEIEGIPTVQSKKGTSRAAFVGRDGVLGGDAESVLAAIHTLRGKAPSVTQDALLSGLYGGVDALTDIALVTRVPDEARIALRTIAAARAPELAELESMQALTANLTTSGGRLAGALQIIARDPAQATRIVELGATAVQRLLALPGIGLTPAAGVLRSIQSEARGERATFAGSVKVSTVETLLELLPALEQLTDSLNEKPEVVAAPDAGVPDAAVVEQDAKPSRRHHRRRAKEEPANAESDPEL